MHTKYRGNISWLKVVSWILQNNPTGSSYAHKNMRKFIYYTLNCDPTEEFPAHSDISKYFFLITQ
jgi:hypothetical protein